MIFERVCFIGLGLIGASLAQLMRDKKLAKTLVASSRSQATLDKGLAYGLIDAGFLSAREAAQGCDLIVIATPVKATRTVLADIADVMLPDTIITDVGSTKANVVADAMHIFNGKLPKGFVPAHPIAGAENSGIDARNADLFVHHKVILTPLPSSSKDAVTTLTRLWQLAGADVVVMEAKKHDQVLARTSHLPHLLAFNLVAQLAAHNDNMDMFRFAAGGFRDFTRIAASDPTMWHDICFANQTAILAAIDEFSTHLSHLKQIIAKQDSDALMGLLTHTQAARQHFGHMLNQTPYLEKNTMTQSYHIRPGQHIQGTFTVPGDKSVSHRSIMFGSLAEGITEITGFLEGEDALATLQAFRDMGVVIEGPEQGKVTVHGVGLHGLKPPPNALYMGNSGTSMRLLSGILAAQSFNSVMTGDKSLSKRPMERVAKPLRQMGAKLQTTGERGTPPLSIKTSQSLTGINYAMPIASAQVKSCLLLAGLWATGETAVTEPEITRDHTERMLTAFGYPVHSDTTSAGKRISLMGGGKLTATNIQVPADISSAAFFMVAASIATGSNITLTEVGINPTRTGVLDILKLMGANLHFSNKKHLGGEPVADIHIQSAPLKGINIPPELVPLAIDEFPAIFIAASCATGKTVLTEAAELRVKESDRIAVMATGLQTLGIDCTVTDDGIEIIGKGDAAVPNSTIFTGGQINSHHDHRIAMSFAVASLRASDDIIINGTQTVNTSFPHFAELANNAGMHIKVVNA